MTRSRTGTIALEIRMQRFLSGCGAALAMAVCLNTAMSFAQAVPEPVAAHIAAARAAGGALWPAAIDQMCGPREKSPGPVQPRPPEPASPPPAPARESWYRAPAQVFDNLYVLATKSANGGVSAWAIKTSAGIILIDATYDYSVEAIVDDGLRALGLNPADIKAVFVTHNHRDHVGGARYLQDRYQPHIYLAAADWDIVRKQNPTDDPSKPPVPRRDLDATDGQRYTLGDTTISVYVTPGHTPGTLSFLIPVTIKGVSHLAAFWGGTGISRQTGAADLALHSASAKRLDGIAAQAKADILLSNHDGFSEYFKRLDASRANPGAPNPFVVGTDGVSRLLQAVQHCSQANIAALQASAQPGGTYLSSALPSPPAREPSWAFQVIGGKAADPQSGTLPGSRLTYTMEQIDDLLNPPDWFPDTHPPAPPVVQKGHGPALACGSCHLMSGLGHPESSGLTGLTADYIVRQMVDFKSGARRDIARMNGIASALTDDEVRQAAAWFASLPTRRFVRVVEAERVPQTFVGQGRMRFAQPGGAMEPIGARIITLPEDQDNARLRHPHSGFVAYVPPGSIEKGKALAEGGNGKTVACALCHGPELRGGRTAPNLRNVHPIYTARQLYIFKDHTRAGTSAAAMDKVVAALTDDDVIAVSAYLGSLEP
ncbi:MAG: MBL fold metallo-hydrolase [Acidobacteriota bacterium]